MRAAGWHFALGGSLVAAALPLAFLENAYILNLATVILIYGVTGASWNLLGGFAGQPSFGHAAFFGVGAYTFAILFSEGGPWTVPGLLVGGTAALLVSLPIGALIFRLRGPYFALSMLAFAEILRLVAQNWAELTRGATGYLLNPTLTDRIAQYYLILVALAALLGVTAAMAGSRPGFYFLAIREDQDVAEALGVDAQAYKMLALAVSAFFTGVAGAFYANYFAYIEPNVVFSAVEISLATYLIVVLGGMGTVMGPAVGSLVLTSVSEIFRVFTGSSNVLFYGILIVVVVLFMPDGVVGMARSAFLRRAAPAAA